MIFHRKRSTIRTVIFGLTIISNDWYNVDSQRCINFNIIIMIFEYPKAWTSGLPGHIASWHFWQVCSHNEFQKMVIIPFVYLEKINIFVFENYIAIAKRIAIVRVLKTLLQFTLAIWKKVVFNQWISSFWSFSYPWSQIQ